MGPEPQITDAELINLAVMQALQGHTGKLRWLHHAVAYLRGMFPYLPRRPRYNKPLLVGDKNYFGAEFETTLDEGGIELLRPARADEQPGSMPGSSNRCASSSSPIFDTFKGQLNLEHHQGRDPAGGLVRVLQHILALTTAI